MDQKRSKELVVIEVQYHFEMKQHFATFTASFYNVWFTNLFRSKSSLCDLSKLANIPINLRSLLLSFLLSKLHASGIGIL